MCWVGRHVDGELVNVGNANFATPKQHPSDGMLTQATLGGEVEGIRCLVAHFRIAGFR